MRVPLAALMALLCALATGAIAQTAPAAVNQAAIDARRAPEVLGAYRFFHDAAARTPNAGVTPYGLNTPLYSDGALKFRYLYMPPGAHAQYDSEGVFGFPPGTVLIKTFAFASDMRRPGQNIRFLETRLLLRRENGWEARVYVWNEAQTEARLTSAGPDIAIAFIDEHGAPANIDWDVPNTNQCSGCHEIAGELRPIGPSARNLNGAFDYADGPDNQLSRWTALGLLADAPAPAQAPSVPNVYDPASGTLEARARAYLDVNCAHCHNPEGAAHTSGLDLRWAQDQPIRWGVLKRPVAAGRGSAGHAFAIEPGHPERSFLLTRMESADPGTMMPELGRQLVDQRATALIREWIAGMDEQGRARQ